MPGKLDATPLSAHLSTYSAAVLKAFLWVLLEEQGKHPFLETHSKYSFVSHVRARSCFFLCLCGMYMLIDHGEVTEFLGVCSSISLPFFCETVPLIALGVCSETSCVVHYFLNLLISASFFLFIVLLICPLKPGFLYGFRYPYQFLNPERQAVQKPWHSLSSTFHRIFVSDMEM